MFALVHQMRTRIMTSPSFTGERILAAILFENTMDSDIEGQPTADYLWNVKRVVPFLKVDKGLAAEKDGVQLMKPMPELAALLDKAKAKRIFGTKMRSFIRQANAARHQGHREPAVRSGSADHCRRPRADHRAGSRHSLPGKGQGRRACSKRPSSRSSTNCQWVSWSCSSSRLPEQDDFYAECVSHPNVVRVVALSGGYTREECQRPPAQESRHRGELFAGASRGAVGPAIRCRVQRPAGCIHSEYL